MIGQRSGFRVLAIRRQQSPIRSTTPPHYNSHPSGVECVVIAEHMTFCAGNAMKYLWRADQKGSQLEDLAKSKWYIEREIARLGKSGCGRKDCGCNCPVCVKK